MRASAAQKLLCRDRVELGHGFVEDQHLRLHHHHRGQIQNLLLPARQRKNQFFKPFADAEIVRRLRHAPADHGAGQPEVLEAERHLVPYRVRDDLVLGALHDKADLTGALPRGKRADGLSLVGHTAGQRAVRRDLTLEGARQRGLAAARRSAHHDEFRSIHRKADIPQCRLIRARIGERHVLKHYDLHRSASLPSASSGNISSAAYAA